MCGPEVLASGGARQSELPSNSQLESEFCSQITVCKTGRDGGRSAALREQPPRSRTPALVLEGTLVSPTQGEHFTDVIPVQNLFPSTLLRLD